MHGDRERLLKALALGSWGCMASVSIRETGDGAGLEGANRD
jgi:hypothetical protein